MLADLTRLPGVAITEAKRGDMIAFAMWEGHDRVIRLGIVTAVEGTTATRAKVRRGNGWAYVDLAKDTRLDCYIGPASFFGHRKSLPTDIAWAVGYRRFESFADAVEAVREELERQMETADE